MNGYLALLMMVLFSLSALADGLPEAVVRIPVANMFASASTDAEVVSQAIYDSKVSVLEQAGEFSRVQTEDGYSGWIRNVELQNAPSIPDNATFARVSSL